MKQKSSLAIIVPCYNEVDSVEMFCEDFQRFKESFKEKFLGFSLKMVIVDNNSTDGSSEVLKKCIQSCENITVVSCVKQGYGAALKHGFSSISADYYGFIDMDATYPIMYFCELLEMMDRKNLDIVFGARMHSRSEMPFIRNLGNKFYATIVRVLFKSRLTDVCSGMRIFKAAKLHHVCGIAADDLSFSIELTLLAHNKKWQMSELPIPYGVRMGKSKLSVVKDGLIFFRSILINYIKK